MNTHFKLKYDEMRDNSPPLPVQDVPEQGETYARESNVRNICFAPVGGNRIFLNYGYLVSGEFSPADNTIVLSFTTHTILLTGVHLENLFYEFMQHIPREIVCVDKRYNATADNNPVVNEIRIKKHAE